MIHPIINIIHALALFSWTSFTTFAIIGIIAQLYKVTPGIVKKKELQFVLVSVASEGVRSSLFEGIQHARLQFPEYRLNVLIDEGAELTQELLLLQEENLAVVIVPKSYRQDLLAKGRAINYFIEKFVHPQWWYSFIDDDNLIMDDRFLYEIPVYEKKGYVVCNPVLKPRPGRSTASYVMDWIRYFDDITIFRFFTGLLKQPVMGLHGELLTVKGSVLGRIGFARHSYTEDFRFAAEIVRGGYKSWQSETILSIKSPNTLRDLLKQRGRWFKGLWKDLRYVPLEMKIIVGWRLILWVVGIFGSWAFSFLWIIFHNPVFLLLPGGMYYWMVYIYAIKKGGLRYLLLIPVFGVIECVSFTFGLRSKHFVVIDKN